MPGGTPVTPYLGPAYIYLCSDTNKGIIMHELYHLLGFHHENVRPDMNAYVSTSPMSMPYQPSEYAKYSSVMWGYFNFNSLMTKSQGKAGGYAIEPNLAGIRSY